MSTPRARAILLSVSLTTSIAFTPLAVAGPRACGCQDLPALVKEVIEQEYLAALFKGWSSYVPISFNSASDVNTKALKDFNTHFYPNGNQAGNGSQDGGHNALGTAYMSDDCHIGVWQYNQAGNPVNQRGQEIVKVDDAGHATDGRRPPADNNQYLKPTTEKDWMNGGNECDAIRRYQWLHEKHHQDTCTAVNAAGNRQKWSNMEFFTQEDAQAYKAGVDYLRSVTGPLAKSCGWEGSTGPVAVPTPARAKELAAQAARKIKDGAAKSHADTTIRNAPLDIIAGNAVDTAPMEDLLLRWDSQCANGPAPGCSALATSIEAGLINLLRDLRRQGALDRSMLLDAAQADLPQLKQLAMGYLGTAQTPEEVDFALKMTEHFSPGIREAARNMLSASDDPRWLKIKPLWQTPGKSDYSSLVPDNVPTPALFGLASFGNLSYRPYGRSETQWLFTTQDSPERVAGTVFKDKSIMVNQEDIQRRADEMKAAMTDMQAALTKAAQTGNMAKMMELSSKLMAMQKTLMPADPGAINTVKDSTGILLEKDTASGLPRKLAHIRRDTTTNQTVVTFESTKAP